MEGINIMSYFTMDDVRNTVISYLDNSNVVPEDMDTDQYAEATYYMDGLCSAIYQHCLFASTTPDELDSDVFVSLMEQYDAGQTVSVDIMLTSQARDFGFGMAVRPLNYIGPDYHEDTDSYIWVNLHLNRKKYGEAYGVNDLKLEDFADCWDSGKAFRRDLKKRFGDAEHHYASMQSVEHGYLDLTARLDDVFDISAPSLPAVWYHDSRRDLVDIPIHVIKDRRI